MPPEIAFCAKAGAICRCLGKILAVFLDAKLVFRWSNFLLDKRKMIKRNGLQFELVEVQLAYNNFLLISLKQVQR